MRYLLPLVLWLLAACDRPAQPDEPTGSISLSWVGSLTGEMKTTTVGRWCESDSLLEMLALDGDVGLGLSILGVDTTLRRGQHPVLSGAISANWRPLALGAFRWVSDSALKGFEATGGNVNITSSDSGFVSGSLDLRLRLSGGFDTLRLQGEFDRVPVLPAIGTCGRIFKPKKTS